MGSRSWLCEAAVGGIEVTASIRETGGRHPVCGSLAQAEGMFIAKTRIAHEADVRPKLKGVCALGPGKVIQKLIHWDLSIVAVSDALIESVEQIPRLV